MYVAKGDTNLVRGPFSPCRTQGIRIASNQLVAARLAVAVLKHAHHPLEIASTQALNATTTPARALA
jgi:molybdopterin-guanine dinucleotide biosynthesis protein